MFRIRLASGEETVFRSVEELALGIQSGAISPAAQIFHSASQQWLPIATHPEYERARARAATLAATADTGPLPLPALLEAAGGPTVPIYQMFSKSAREIAERRRPRWVIPAASTVVGCALIAVVVLVLLPEPPGADEAVRIASSAPHPSSAPSHLAPILSEESMLAARNAPYNLAGRFSRAADSTRRSLTDSSRDIGLTLLATPDRLRSEDGLLAGREALAQFDTIVQEYRSRQHRLDSIYRDSANSLKAHGQWSLADMQEWRLRTPRLESPAEAARVDSIIRALDRLYALMLEQKGSVTVTPVAVRFEDRKAGTTYDALRSALLRQTAITQQEAGRLAEPLALLLGGFGDMDLPLRSSH
jgi:hypothetical protein